MGSDRARNTYDETRQYRRVVSQQGRVVLEADANEASMIAEEETRREVADVIGSYGVPFGLSNGERGDGYRIYELNADTRDFRIGTGSLYVAGWRITQHNSELTYGSQSDWLDGPVPLLADVQAAMPDREVVYLRLREQEVSAVEDPALIEPALGGPDTAQRVRLIRRVGRSPITGSNEQSAFEWINAESAGIVIDRHRTTVGRTASLAVSFDSVNAAYIGPDNQMIRVQGGIAAGSDSTVATQLLWAYDDASSLYSAVVPDPSNPATLKLLTMPVDTRHQPKSNQYAEVLLPVAALGDEAFAAAPVGASSQIVQGYDPDIQTIGLETELPSPYITGAPLFVRIWENSIDAASAFGAAVPLTEATGSATGLQVQLSDRANSAASVVPGDYWTFAVRRATPTDIFPARYLQPQPPEGPREWVCPLAVIDWREKYITDCRPRFRNLTALSYSNDREPRGCCTITISPQDLHGHDSLQSVIDHLRHHEHSTICLMPGEYTLSRPLRITQHSNLTIKACRKGVTVRNSAESVEDFLEGLVTIERSVNVTLCGIKFLLPDIRFREVGGKLAGLDEHTLEKIVGDQFRDMRASVGISLLHCETVTISECIFEYSAAPDAQVFAAAIFGRGNCHEITISGNRFEGSPDRVGSGSGHAHYLYGYLQSASVRFTRRTGVENFGESAGSVLPSSFDRAVFKENHFENITAAVTSLAGAGLVRFVGNVVKSCGYGLLLLPERSLAFASVIDLLTVRSAALQSLRQSMRTMVQALQVTAIFSWSYPLPPWFEGPDAIEVPEGVEPRIVEEHWQVFEAGFRKMMAVLREVEEAVRAEEGVVGRVAAALELNSLYSHLAALMRRAANAFPERPVLSLHVVDNEIEAFVAEGQSGSALLVWEDEREVPSAMILSANKLRNQSSNFPTAIIYLVTRCAITGNLILNADPNHQGDSLQMYPGSAMSSITGNVFRGVAKLPPRRTFVPALAAPMDTWHFLNSEL